MIAHGLVVVAWGPFTFMAVVPLTIRLRRTAQHPVTQRVARQASKLNFSVFLRIVVVGTLSPGVMLLEFSPSFGDDGGADVSSELICDTEGEVVTCSVENAQGIDHVTASANGGDDRDRGGATLRVRSRARPTGGDADRQGVHRRLSRRRGAVYPPLLERVPEQ